MADVTALLLNVVDAKDLGVSGSRRSSSGSFGGAGRRSGRGSGNNSSSNLAVQSSPSDTWTAGDALVSTSSVTVASGASLSAQAPPGATEQLGPVTRTLLPAVAALGRWWRARAPWSASDAELNSPQLHIDHLAQVITTDRPTLFHGMQLWRLLVYSCMFNAMPLLTRRG